MYGDEEFLMIINDVVKSELTLKEVAKKYHMSESSIKRMLSSNGYKYDKKQKLWYSAAQKQAIYIMNNCEVEEEIEYYSKKRYYDRYENLYPDGIKEEKTENLILHKGLFDELEEVADDFGCDYAEELIELVLLRFLDKYRKKNLIPLFRKKYFLDHGFNEKEVEILMKYDEETIAGGAEELLWEDDSLKVVQELNRLYRKELNDKNIDFNNESNDYEYLKEKYDEANGNIYFKEEEKKYEREYYERVEKNINEKREKNIPLDECDLKDLKELEEYKKNEGDK